jgi:hypothetical protein
MPLLPATPSNESQPPQSRDYSINDAPTLALGQAANCFHSVAKFSVLSQTNSINATIMIFTAPPFVPSLPDPLPLQETIGDFCLTERLAKVYVQGSAEKQPVPFVEAAIDRSWTTDAISTRVGQLSRALCSAWNITPGQKWHKQVAILASNCVRLCFKTYPTDI